MGGQAGRSVCGWLEGLVRPLAVARLLLLGGLLLVGAGLEELRTVGLAVDLAVGCRGRDHVDTWWVRERNVRYLTQTRSHPTGHQVNESEE